MSLSFDARPLTEPVDRSEVAGFTKATRGPMTVGNIVGIIVVGIVSVVMASAFVPIAASYIVRLFADGQVVQGLIVSVILAAIIAGIAFAIVKGVQYSRIKHYRLYRFAAANSMSYVGSVKDPGFPGMIFHEGDSRIAEKVLRRENPRFVEFGNFQYSTGSGKNRTTHEWGYVAIKLDVPLPNIVLDSSGNNSIFGSSLPASFSKKQRLGLEGDFDKHFALYCPVGYERDALYLFTPDVMTRFIDNAAHLDVEIVDDWLFLYTQRKVSTLDAATWAWIFGAVDALTTKLDQWGRWRDERLTGSRDSADPQSVAATVGGTAALPFATVTSAPGVAAQGRRLKQSVPWVLVVLVGALVIFGVITYFF